MSDPGTGRRRVVLEADGASRGNPGPSAYGAVLKDAETDAVIAEDAGRLGVTTNNVAEYSGLIAGLRLAAEHAPDAALEVRMDSKLVIEQMAGRWKIKHPGLRPLAEEARGLAPETVTWRWIPRDQNAHADRLGNEALDGSGSTATASPADAGARLGGGGLQEQSTARQTTARGWSAGGRPTTLILVRHGVTDHTVGKRFSGGLGGSNPGLNDEGRDQVRATAQWLAPIADDVATVIASPVRRTRESAEIVAEMLDREIEIEAGFAEMEFGEWDGLTFAQIAEQRPEELEVWLGSLDHAPGGGESFREVEERVIAARDRVLAAHAGETVVVVSHVTPIKTLVAHALGAPLESLYRMELAPASVSVVSWFDGGRDGEIPMASMRMFNGRPTETSFLPR